MFNKTVCTAGAAAGSVARELKIVHGILMTTGETNDEISTKLEALKLEVSALDEKLAPFLSSGAKLVTEAEL